MNKIITCLIIVTFFIHACHNSVNSYENNLGIKPGIIAQIDTANYTTIEWEDTVKNLGEVKQGDSVFIKFRFRNTGDGPLYLTSVHPSCGCIVADYSQNAIQPGEGGELTATFNSRYQSGYINKTITVTSNTSNGINHLLSFAVQIMDSSQLIH